MATNTGHGAYQNGNAYSDTQQRPSSDHISPYYKLVAAAVVTMGLVALFAKLLQFWLRSLKEGDHDDAQEADAAATGIRGGDGVVAPRQQPQAPAPAALAVEMARSMGPLVCTYRRADGWPAEAACAVCLAELADGDALRVLPVCMHYFHAACVGEWLRAHDTCPLCRAPLTPPAAADDAAAV